MLEMFELHKKLTIPFERFKYHFLGLIHIVGWTKETE